MIKNIKLLLLNVLIFFYIYWPNLFFFPINIVDIIAIFSIIYIVVYIKSFVNFVYENKLFFTLLIILIWYSFLIEIIHENNISTNSFSILNLRIILEAIIPSFFLAHIIYKLKIRIELVYKILLIVAVSQFFISLYMFNMDNKIFLLETIMKIDPSSPLWNPQHLVSRGYGLAKNHLFAFPFSQGLIAVIGLYISIKTKSFLWLFISLLIAVTAFINARIGLLPIILFFVSYFTLYFVLRLLTFQLSFKLLIKVLIVGLFGYLLAYQLLNTKELEDNFEKLTETSIATYELLFENKKTSTYEDLFSSDFWKMPHTTREWILGGSFDSLNSDVGYIRNLHYGGLSYIIIFYFCMIVLVIKILKVIGFQNDKSISKSILIITIMISLFVAEIKGNIFSINETMRLIILLWIIGYFGKKEKKYIAE